MLIAAARPIFIVAANNGTAIGRNTKRNESGKASRPRGGEKKDRQGFTSFERDRGRGRSKEEPGERAYISSPSSLSFHPLSFSLSSPFRQLFAGREVNILPAPGRTEIPHDSRHDT